MDTNIHLRLSVVEDGQNPGTFIVSAETHLGVQDLGFVHKETHPCTQCDRQPSGEHCRGLSRWYWNHLTHGERHTDTFYDAVQAIFSRAVKVGDLNRAPY